MSAWNRVGIELSPESSATSRVFFTHISLLAFAYTVTATGITKDNSAITIVKPGWTGGLSAAALRGLF